MFSIHDLPYVIYELRKSKETKCKWLKCYKELLDVDCQDTIHDPWCLLVLSVPGLRVAGDEVTIFHKYINYTLLLTFLLGAGEASEYIQS